MIQTEDLSKQFGDFWAVDGVNLEVQPGQVLALLGQNGAGKTTTIRMLTSVLTPTRGRMSLIAQPLDRTQCPPAYHQAVPGFGGDRGNIHLAQVHPACCPLSFRIGFFIPVSRVRHNS